MSPKDKRQLAGEHLQTAKTAAEEGRVNEAINALFYASEAAVVALSDQHEIDTKKRHSMKAGAASQLYKRGVLASDYGPLLRILNQARKEIWYDGEEPELDSDLEDLVAEVEGLVEAASQ